MEEKRENTRYQSRAKVNLKQAVNGDAFLKDLSVTGCCVECGADIHIRLNTRYKVEVIPEDSSEIGPFFLSVESKWIRTGTVVWNIGFSVVKSPRGKQFLRYVDYLSWRYAQGNSMTGDGAADIPAMIIK